MHIDKNITKENIAATVKVLVDNGVDAEEAGYVLQAIGYALLDVELEELIRLYFTEEKEKVQNGD